MVDKKEGDAPKGFLTWAIIRDVLAVIFLAVFAWKLFNSDLKYDFSDFKFTDLLALLLSLFSVWLAVAFYFKANEASNKFYDNTYRFTSEMSEILGRIEAGFGERLRHLDEGYSGLRDRFDRLPIYAREKQDDEAVRAEEEVIKKKENEQRAVIEALAERANLADKEKQSLFQTLEEKHKELELARLELQRLKDAQSSFDFDPELRDAVLGYVGRKLFRQFERGPKRLITFKDIANSFGDLLPDLPPAAMKDLKKVGAISDSGELTKDAVIRVRTVVMNLLRRKTETEQGNG